MRSVAFFLALCLTVVLIAGLSPRMSFAQLLLNEILADPGTDWDGDGSVGSRADEWIEVINAGTSSIDLSSYRLGDLSGGYAWRFGFSGTLEPGGVIVVHGSAAQTWQSENGFPAMGLSLNNSGDTVFLYAIQGGDTLIADSYAYAPHEVQDDRATGRMDSDRSEWRVFDGLNPYTGEDPPLGTGCYPTPGLLNTCVPQVPAEGATWGAVKQTYVD
ncbi:MAG: lamin tail domain-containing protein [Candidatus Latescibacterota bacterium]|nr:MAG: lamin tail domain-containing protein [Candidatus Latescibacterota bacterium]